MNLHLQAADWLSLFGHYLVLSLLSLGGAITTTPEMHRYLVSEQGWLTDPQFMASVAIAQAAPGPNVLFVALMGWMVGLNAGSMWWGLLGVMITMTGIMLPSTILTFTLAQWGHRNRDLRAVRAFKQGMAPITIAILISTGYIMARGDGDAAHNWLLWLLAGAATVVVWRTKIPLLWLLAVGAVVGWFLLG
jgi:chromate transporter